jgi:putative transcriptional regulator
MFGRTTEMIGISATLAGKVDPALRLLADTQAVLTRARPLNSDVIDVVGALALENENPASVGADFGHAIWTKIDAHENMLTRSQIAAKAAGASLQELLALPEPVRDLALEGAGRTGWTFAGPGVKTMMINTGGKLTTKLLRIEPGHGAPNHDHTGTEYTLVLSGAFEDGSGKFGPGDVSIKRAGQIHHPVATQCGVCFALSVEEGEVAFTGALGVLQRLFTRH